jgi:hypothetical protein
MYFPGKKRGAIMAVDTRYFIKRIEGMVSYKTKPNQIGWQNYYDWRLHINQGWRDASLIGVSGNEFLFEYEMPNGKYYLHSVGLNEQDYFEVIGKSVNKNRLSQKWAAVVSETGWEL